MSFLAPLMLIGAIAGGIPIALHFFYRSRYRTVPWAAMKFLLTSIEQTSRRLRFQELLLLILRVALLCVLAFALARPATRLARGGSGQADAVDAVFIIDVSMSMDGRVDASTRLDRAKEAALAVLDDLPPYSTVQVLAVSEQSRLLGPTAPSNLDHARYLIQELAVTHRATDFLPAIQEAEAVLQRGQAPNKELYLFSDMHKLGWDRQGAATRTKLRELSERTTICLVRCGEAMARNATIVGLEIQSALPHAGERAAFTAFVKNTGRELLRDVGVSLEIDGEKAETEATSVGEIGPGETRPVSMTTKLPSSPAARGETSKIVVVSASLSSDDLAADNRFGRLIQVHDLLRVLIVDGAPNAREPEKASSYFLAHALRPVPEAFWDKYHVRPIVLPPGQVTPESLDDMQACIFANVALQPGSEGGTPSPEFIKRLGEFVRAGGTLMIFAGPNVSDGPRRTADAYNQLLGDEAKLLPAQLAGDERIAPGSPVRLDPTSIDPAGPLSKFRVEPLNAIGQVEVFQSLRFATAPVKGDVMLASTDRQPAVLLRQVGDGQVVLVTLSADQRWTDWPIRQTFLPFVHVMLGHCLQGSLKQHELVAGQPLRCRVSASAAGLPHDLRLPDGTLLPLAPAEFEGDRAWLRADQSERAGLYHVQIRQSSEAQAPARSMSDQLFAVTPDLRELENLDAYSDAELDEWLSFEPLHLTAGADVQGFAATERLRREWTVWLLVVVLLMAAAEAALAWWCGRGW